MVLAIICVFVSSTLLDQFHYAVVPHEVCAEHGELVHGDHHEAQGLAEVHSGASSWSALPSDEEHAHALCAVCVSDELTHVTAHTGSRLDLHGPSIQPDPLSDGWQRVWRDLYLLAPKTSPPV